MAGCGCGCGGSGASKSDASLGAQVENIFEGKKKLDILEALQMIAAVSTILLFVKYMFSK